MPLQLVLLFPVACPLYPVTWFCGLAVLRVKFAFHSLSFSGWNCFPPFALSALLGLKFFLLLLGLCPFFQIRVHSRSFAAKWFCCGLLPIACGLVLRVLCG